MCLEFYSLAMNPPSRAVKVMLVMLDVPYKLEALELDEVAELDGKEVLAKYPVFSIPFILDENNKYIRDSHCINVYLLNRFGNIVRKRLYPTDPETRAIVEEKFYFDSKILIPAVVRVKKSYVVEKTITGVTPQIIKEYEEIYDTLEHWLMYTYYIAGPNPTLADISFYVSLTAMAVIWPANPTKYRLIEEYIVRCITNIIFLKTASDPGLEDFKKLMKDFKRTLPVDPTVRENQN